jgi:hypothetical protein
MKHRWQRSIEVFDHRVMISDGQFYPMCITGLPAILLSAKFHQKVSEIKILKWSDSGSFQIAKTEEWVKLIIIIIIVKFSYLCFQCVAKYRKSD